MTKKRDNAFIIRTPTKSLAGILQPLSEEPNQPHLDNKEGDPKESPTIENTIAPEAGNTAIESEVLIQQKVENSPPLEITNTEKPIQATSLKVKGKKKDTEAKNSVAKQHVIVSPKTNYYIKMRKAQLGYANAEDVLTAAFAELDKILDKSHGKIIFPKNL